LADAVIWALRNNPELATLRQQHGFAAAGLVIAETYPFNPLWEWKIWPTNGPESAGITNRVALNHIFLLELEVHGQGKFRRQAAQAAVTRTDWEIAHQEVLMAVRAARAYQAVLYREKKMDLIRQTIRVNERAADQVEKMVRLGRLRPADLIVLRTEVEDARAGLAQGRTTLAPAWSELRRVLGAPGTGLVVEGDLEVPPRRWDAEEVTRAALARRADLRAVQAAVAEAEGRLRLEIANRYGNPTVGPNYEYNETRVNFIGAQFNIPLPVFNTHRGEILQRQAELSRALAQVRQTEVLVRQDVDAALRRLARARAWLDSYQKTVVPGLERSLEEMNRLFLAGEPGVDVLKLVDANRKLLKARDVELDALWEVAQAQSDLAAAVGDVALAINPEVSLDEPASCPGAKP
jgi:cobalt-zinc-cadmium efflux system outer membrane protein